MPDDLGIAPATAINIDLNGQVALVTGAARGLGAAIARGLGRARARVIVADLDLEGAQAIAAEIHGAVGISLDVRDAGSVARAARIIEDQFGDISVLVNNAGIAGRGRIDEDGAEELWTRIIDVNLHGTFRVTQAFIPALKRTRGAIVNVGSVTSFVAGSSTAGYTVSKAAIRSLTQVLARELAASGVRVNAIAPGVMETAMAVTQRGRPGGLDWFLSRTMLARVGEADEVVGPVLFLASELASYITGTTLPVDGGFLAL